MEPLVVRARVGLDRRGAEFGGVIHRRSDHPDGDALAAVPAADGDAGNDPDRKIVDGWGRARAVDRSEIGARTDRDPPDGFLPAIGDQARRFPAAREPRDLGAAGRVAALVEAPLALLRSRVAGEKTPARRAPGPGRDRFEVVDVCGR